MRATRGHMRESATAIPEDVEHQHEEPRSVDSSITRQIRDSGPALRPRPLSSGVDAIRSRARFLRGLFVTVLALLLIAILVYPLEATMALPLGELGAVLGRARDLPGLGDAFFNTAMLALGTLVVGQVIGISLSLCAMRLPGRWFGVGAAVAVAPVFVPALATIVGWAILFSPRIGYGNQILRATPFFSGSSGPLNVYSLPWIVGITSVYLAPYVFLFVAPSLREMDPAQESAARIAGAGWLRAQRDVVLPAVRPAIIYSMVISLLLALGQFTAPLLLGASARVDVITTLMYRLTVTDFQSDRPLAALLAVPAIVAALVLVAIQRRRVGSLGRYAAIGKGTGSRSQSRRIFFVPILLFFVVTVVPPIAALVVVSMQKFWSTSVDWGSLNLDNYRSLFADGRFHNALVNTVELSAVGTLVATFISLLTARFLLTSERRIRGVIDYIVNLPVAIPAIIFGFGVFLSFGVGPVNLYGTKWLFVIAWVIMVLPHGVRILLAGQSRLGKDLVPAARVAGSREWHAVLVVVLPLLRRVMAASALLMFVIMSQEFAAAALLRTVQNDVLSTFLYEGWNDSRYPEVAAIALIMVLVTVAGAGTCLLLGGRDPLERRSTRRRKRLSSSS